MSINDLAGGSIPLRLIAFSLFSLLMPARIYKGILRCGGRVLSTGTDASRRGIGSEVVKEFFFDLDGNLENANDSPLRILGRIPRQFERLAVSYGNEGTVPSFPHFQEIGERGDCPLIFVCSGNLNDWQ